MTNRLPEDSKERLLSRIRSNAFRLGATGELPCAPSIKSHRTDCVEPERIRGTQVVVTLWRPLEKGVLQ